MKFNENFRRSKSQSASVINFQSTHPACLCSVMINSSIRLHAIEQACPVEKIPFSYFCLIFIILLILSNIKSFF